jgi:2-iminobutanoate/2-iminopropanoate deaminase
MGRRKVIELEGMGHRAPISLAVMIDNILYSSGISGIDTKTESYSSEPAEQAACMFRNIEQVMAEAGGSPADIIYVQLRLKDRSLREHVDPHWLKMFPDPKDRPARHAENAPELGGDMIMQCQIVAVLPK